MPLYRKTAFVIRVRKVKNRAALNPQKCQTAVLIQHVITWNTGA